MASFDVLEKAPQPAEHVTNGTSKSSVRSRPHSSRSRWFRQPRCPSSTVARRVTKNSMPVPLRLPERTRRNLSGYAPMYLDPTSGHGLLLELKPNVLWAYDPDKIAWTKVVP